MLVRPARSSALTLLFAALTLSLGFASHLVVEAIGSGTEALLQPSHIVLGLLSLCGTAAALVALGVGRSPAERRRRVALAVKSRPRFSFLASAGAQAFFAAGTLALEGRNFHVSHLGLAIVCGILSIALGAALVRAIQGTVVRYALERFALCDPAPAPPIRRRESRVPHALRLLLYALFIPNRPPPLSPIS